MKMLGFLTAAFLFCCLASIAQSNQDLDRQESPFEGLRWNDKAPEVLVDGTWYRPLSIEGVEVTEILAFCGERWPRKQQKRFAEDLVEAMALMDHLPPQEVTLVLETLDSSEQVTLSNVAMTRENRRALREANSGTSRGRPRPPAPPAVLSLEAARVDLMEFGRRLEDQFAYLELRDIDLQRELKAIDARLSDPMPTAKFANELHQLLMRFGDGHAGVSSAHDPRPQSYPQVLLCDAQGGVVALLPDRSGLLDPARPFVSAIDGEPLEVWLEAQRPRVVAGSPQLVRRRSIQGLRELELLRSLRGKPASKLARYSLVESAGAKPRVTEVPMTGDRPRYGSWPAGGSRVLDGNIGYLRLERMDDERIPDLHRSMAEFKDTQGLVVDVRGNGGGSRGLLLALSGYLNGPDEGPWVGNVAAYRLSEEFEEDHLEARFMQRQDSPAWTDDQRAVVAAAAEEFEPEWPLPEGFSAWHYLVLGRSGTSSEYFYPHNVIVLSDAGCFSATDIFLGALHGRPRVTLLGQPSSGGSARSQGFVLPNSSIQVRCASMASFRLDGRLYDGRGVETRMEDYLPLPADFLVGGGDDLLVKAVELLHSNR